MTLSARARTAVLAGLVVYALSVAPVAALETDQFLAWRRPLPDSTALVNAKINLEIQRALDELARRGGTASSDEVARAVWRRLEFEIFQPLEVWAVQSPLVEHVPARGDEEAGFLAASIYRRSHLWDIAMWMPLSPTIELGGVRMGTDKLAHFASSGWRYRNAYLRRIRRGETAAEAELGAIRWGILEERSINGTLSSGIFSRADLEANHAGMLFYLNLCEGDDPVLVREGGRWRVRRPYDIGAVVTPEWDESFKLPFFRRGRWRATRPEIEAYCGALADPVVSERFAAYRRRDTVTASERVVAELVRERKLPDPAPFSLAAVCPQAEVLPPAASDGSVATVTPAADPGELAASLVAIDEDRTRRTFGLWRASVSSPLSLTASLGAVLTPLPRTYDCRSLCELRGLTAQASLGLTGAELAVGWARLFAETGPQRRFLADVSLAYGVRAALMRTWGNSPLEPGAQTLAGVEGALTITRVSFTAGVFAHVGGGVSRNDWVLTGSIGFGF